MNDVHWQLSYMVYLLLCQYQHQLHRRGVYVTLPRLLIIISIITTLFMLKNVFLALPAVLNYSSFS